MGDHLQLERVEGNVGIGRLEMEVGRKLAVMQGKGGFEKAGDAGGGFKVPEIALHGPDE